jgi:hypothetical protein
MKLVDFPALVFVVSLALLLLCVWLGAHVLKRFWPPEEKLREDFGTILAATLTLLGLIIGFTFSMAISRYDQRKNLEEAEANAIGTEFIRADLLPKAEAAQVRALLRDYFDQRVLFYTVRAPAELQQVNDRTAQLQTKLLAAVLGPANATPTPIVALAVAGMNDVLNSQGYTQAAWWNRIPRAAWLLLAAIAACSHVLVGYGARDAKMERRLLLILPLLMSVCFFLIADIDSPRNGVIRVVPQNLLAIADSLRVP